ncbi:MAG: helix-turn-helix transcriptional regulator [Clostridiales bacterium]|nr:helix-turn-helix transcriptional regulator [Clostridiales bacterium]
MGNNKLKQLRGISKLNQQEVAENIGITTSYYGMIENGVRTPNLIIAYKLAKFFSSSIEDIFLLNKTT